MKFATIPSGNAFFKSDDHKDDAAILLEITSFAAQVPTQYGPKDTITCTATYFKTQKDIDEGNGEEVEGTTIQQPFLVKPLAGLIDQATVVKLAQSNPKPGQRPAWIWETPSAETMTKVGEYVDKRDAALQADIDDAPSF